MYKVVIIGCGRIGLLNGLSDIANRSLPCHFNAFYNSSGFEIVGLCDPNDSVANKLQSLNITIPYFASLEELLAACVFEVAVVATSDDTHFAIIQKLMPVATLKLIVCEKPLFNNESAFLAYSELSRQHPQVKVLVNFSRRFIPEYAKLKKQIAADPPHTINIHYSRGLLHNATHYIDLCNWFFASDPVVTHAIQAYVGPDKDDPCYDLQLKYQDTCVRFLSYPNNNLIINEIEIFWDEEKIQINTQGELLGYHASKKTEYGDFLFYTVQESRSLNIANSFCYMTNYAEDCLQKGRELSPGFKESKACFELVNIIKGAKNG